MKFKLYKYKTAANLTLSRIAREMQSLIVFVKGTKNEQVWDDSQKKNNGISNTCGSLLF